MLARLLPLLVASALLAGCAGGSTAPDDGTASPEGTPQEQAAAFTVDGPGWQVGDWWLHEWDFASGQLNFDVKSIVAANASGTYTFATDDLSTAAQHGAFFFMELGTMGPDGVMRNGDFAFPWIQFPLTHNKTWKGTEKNLGTAFEPVSRELEMTARANGTGDARHFVIEAHAGGKLYARYDYQPRLKGFSSFTTYAADANGTPQPVYTITTKDSGTGYTGPIHSATGEMLVNEQPLMHPGSTSSPAGAVSFQTGDATHVFAILFSFAAAGGHHTQLAAPDGQHWEATGYGDLDGNAPAPLPVPGGLQVLTAAQPGQWAVTFSGAGVVAGGGCFLWGVNIVSATL